jgi:hypothetical protein
MEQTHLKRLPKLPGEVAPPAILLGDLDPERPGRREIQDPWGHPPAVFESSFDRIDRCLIELARLAYCGGSAPDRAEQP